MKILLTLSTTFTILLMTLVAQVSYAQHTVTKEGPYSISMLKTSSGFTLQVYSGAATRVTSSITYGGNCTRYPTLQAVLFTKPRALKAFEASGNYDDLNVEKLTGIFTREISKKCPNVTTVRVGLGRGDRLVAASLSKALGWKNTLGKLTLEEAASPEAKAFEALVTTGSANTIMTLMKNRNYADIRRKNSGDYKQFHNQFLSMYSSMCASHINNPVSIEVKSIREVFDSNGFKVDSYETGKSYTIFVDSKYSAAFLRYRNATVMQGLGKILKAEVSDRRNNPNAWDGGGIIAIAKEIGANGERIRRLINQGCQHLDVLSVYDKLGDVLPI